MRKFTTLFIPLLMGATALQAQAPGKAYENLDINHVKARIYNSGDHFWDLTGYPAYEVPKGSGKHANFAHSLWVGGHDTSSTLHLAAQTYRQTGHDHFSGPYRSSHTYDTGVGFSVPFDPENYGSTPVDGGKTLVVYDNGFTVYDPVSNTSIAQTMPVTRTRLQAVLLSNGKTMLLGDNNYPSIQDVFIADPANGYSPQVSLQLHYYHRNSATVTLPNGLTLIAGLAGTELYDPATNTSATTQAMPTPVNGAGFTLLNDGRVFVAGGAIVFSSYNTPRNEIQLFDPATNTWTAGPSMPSGRAFPLTLLQSNGRVLLIGGSPSNNDIYEYDPVANTVAAVGTLTSTNQYCSGGLVSNGDVIFSGTPSIGNGNGILYRYNRSSGLVSEEGFLNLGTHGFTSSLGELVVEFDKKEFRKYDAAKSQFVDMPYQKVWKITKAQVSQFISDFANSSVNFANYPDIQSWPAHGNVAMGEDINLAPFTDVNNDGLYRPFLHGDYPCVPGDQTLWWVFNDDGVHTETGGNTIGMQVEATAYSIDCNTSPCPDSAIGYTTFYHYELSNKGSNNLIDMRAGIWNDVDLGNYADDYIGCDTARGLGFAYNGDANDEGNTGYGLNPPAFGTLLLGQTEMASFITYNNDFTGSGNPQNAEAYFNYLSARFADGTPLIDNGLTGYDPNASGPVTNFIYDGDAGFCSPNASGWSELSAGNTPFDRHMIQATAPQEFNSGDEMTFDFAMVWARDLAVDNLGNVCTLFNAADAVGAYWPSISNCFNQVVQRERPSPSGTGFALYPNPAQNSARIAMHASLEGSKVFVRDLSGRLLQTHVLPEGSTQLDLKLDVVPDGIYLVTVQGPQGSSTRKLAVQH